jgi:hypothetical protein
MKRIIFYLFFLLIFSKFCSAQAIAISPSEITFNLAVGGSEKRQFTIFNPGDEGLFYEIDVSNLEDWFEFSSYRGKILSKDKVSIVTEVKAPADADKKIYKSLINVVISSENTKNRNSISIMPSAQLKATINIKQRSKNNTLSKITGDFYKFTTGNKKTSFFMVLLVVLACIVIYQVLKKKNKKTYKRRRNSKRYGRGVFSRSKRREGYSGKNRNTFRKGTYKYKKR